MRRSEGEARLSSGVWMRIRWQRVLQVCEESSTCIAWSMRKTSRSTKPHKGLLCESDHPTHLHSLTSTERAPSPQVWLPGSGGWAAPIWVDGEVCRGDGQASSEQTHGLLLTGICWLAVGYHALGLRSGFSIQRFRHPAACLGAR